MSVTERVRSLLEEGGLRLVGLLPGASNYTFLAEVTGDDGAAPVVYKPRRGEMPLWDFPEGTLCNREVAASVLADALGWPNVPPTVLREGPHGPGSVQLYVDAVPEEHYFTLRDRFRDVFRAVAAFDVVAGNGDRKSGHLLLTPTDTIWAVDHGLCFAARSWLRTVIWEFADEPLPEELRGDVRRIAGELRTGRLRERLAELLLPEEVDAAGDRAEELVRAGTFPHPGPGRSRPWPAV
ncbi:MAG: SCO1664 family protein [Actinomycetota bacterium]